MDDLLSAAQRLPAIVSLCAGLVMLGLVLVEGRRWTNRASVGAQLFDASGAVTFVFVGAVAVQPTAQPLASLAVAVSLLALPFASRSSINAAETSRISEGARLEVFGLAWLVASSLIPGQLLRIVIATVGISMALIPTLRHVFDRPTHNSLGFGAAWDEAARRLIAGESRDKVIDRLREAGHSDSTARNTITVIASGRSFEAAALARLRLQCRHWLFGQYAALERYRPLLPQLDRLTPEEFGSFFYQNRPVLIRNAARNWNAISAWNRDYLVSKCGDVMVEVMTSRAGAKASEQYAGASLRTRVSFREYIGQVYSGAATNDYYLVAANNFFSCPGTSELVHDVGGLDFIERVPILPDLRLWFGPKGTITPWHYDSQSSILVQVSGKKEFRIRPPWFAEAMDQTEPWYAGPSVDNSIESEKGPVDVSEAHGTLGAGDALFIPVGWWHTVESHEVSVSVTVINVAQGLAPIVDP